MKSIISFGAAAVLASPLFALAAVDTGMQPSVGQLLARQAAVFALEHNLPMACVATTDPGSVQAGGMYTLAWGSFGAEAPGTVAGRTEWTPLGSQIVVAPDKPGTYKWDFKFYSPSSSVSCATTITVKQ